MAIVTALSTSGDPLNGVAKHLHRRLLEGEDLFTAAIDDATGSTSVYRREAVEPTLPALSHESFVPDWHRLLAMEFHPEKRGSHVGMASVNRARHLLLTMAGCT